VGFGKLSVVIIGLM